MELGCFRERARSESDAATRAGAGGQKATWKEIPQLSWKDEIYNNFHIGADIGGSLCKLTFYEAARFPVDLGKLKDFITSSITFGTSGIRDPNLSFSHAGGHFHFLHFQTRRMDGAFALLKQNKLPLPSRFPATGGGAFKFADQFRKQLGVELDKRDEMHCLLLGLNFLLQTVEDECYYLDLSDLPDPMLTLNTKKVTYNMKQENPFPYLLVNIGSGVSILRVDAETKFERVGGTCIGGGTYWGLLRLLTNCTTFEEAMNMAASGNFQRVNMLVSDIYGGDYEEFGLKSSTVASAFGKLVMSDRTKEDYNENDIAAALLHMIGANISQVAYLTALKHNIDRILFAGNFLRHNPVSASFLASSIHYWSKGKIKAIFLKHEGYFGSIGALLTQEAHAPEVVHCERGSEDEHHDEALLACCGGGGDMDFYSKPGTQLRSSSSDVSPSSSSTASAASSTSNHDRVPAKVNLTKHNKENKQQGQGKKGKKIKTRSHSEAHKAENEGGEVNGSKVGEKSSKEKAEATRLAWVETGKRCAVLCLLAMGWLFYLSTFLKRLPKNMSI